MNDTIPDSLKLAQLQRRLDDALAANELLAAAAMKPLGRLMQRIETEVALYRADKLAERNALPTHDPRLPLMTELVDKLGEILGIAPAPLPVAPNAVADEATEDTTPPVITD